MPWLEESATVGSGAKETLEDCCAGLPLRSMEEKLRDVHCF